MNGRVSQFLLQSRRNKMLWGTAMRLMSTSEKGDGKLKGKVAIVTASTEGIGFAVARRLALDGADVVISSRKLTNVEKAVARLKEESINVTGMQCHVGKSEDRKNLIEQTANKHGGIDILVSNAGISPFMGSILDCPEEAWDKIFEINLKAAFMLTKEVVPHMQKRGGGSIIYVSSVAGYHPFIILGPYSVSKTALLGLTRAIAQQTGPDKIRVNCIAPGFVKTKLSENLITDDGLLAKLLEEVPLGRLAKTHEMGGIVSFLCSEDAAYITGETIVLSGGMKVRL